MKQEKEDKELQTRRQFFKKAAKSLLPMLGVIAAGPTVVTDAKGGGGLCAPVPNYFRTYLASRKQFIFFFLLLGLSFSQNAFSESYTLSVNESVTISQDPIFGGYIDNVGLADFLDPHLSFKNNGDGTADITVNLYFDYTAQVSLAFMECYQEYYSGRYHTRGKIHYKTVSITCKYTQPDPNKKVTKVYLPERVRIFTDAEDRTYINPIYEPADAQPNSVSWGFNVGTSVFSHYEVSDGSCWVRGRSAGVGRAWVVIDDDWTNLYASTIIEVVDPGFLPPTSILLPSSIEVSVGAQSTIEPVFIPENTTSVLTWESNDESIATISYGKVIGKNVGKATITVKTTNKLIATCVVNVVYSNGRDDDEDGGESSYKGTVDGHEYVDLGLSVKWATCNVGADNPEDSGGYYAWGETSEKYFYTWNTYQYGTYMNEINIGNDIKGTSYDAAYSNWGSRWRMPTSTEFRELINNCEINKTTRNNIDGYEIIGKNGASIFLPVAGYKDKDGLNSGCTYYWTSNYSSGDPGFATMFLISYKKSSGDIDPTVLTKARMMGMPIRPVTESMGTGIKGIKQVVDVEKQEAPIFDLLGKRLNTPQKGINIIGGKKVLVK